ncbi:MAG: patatin-like phospholipase family protein [Gammaproteobacteria bacterium]
MIKWLLGSEQQDTKTGLVLPGGGARAAYQVGVLKAIAKVTPKHAPTPFSVITGTSAGSINATALAIHAENFRRGVYRLGYVWKNFHAEHVFRTDGIGMTKSGAHWLAAMMLGGLGKYNPHSLLDRTPLRHLLGDMLEFSKIEEAIKAGHLHALGITASGYNTAQSVTFYQANEAIKPWQRERRIGVKTQLSIDHLMASSAIPFIFKAIMLNREYFGDGSMRQMAPISPALHLGADRVLVVGIRKPQPTGIQRILSHEYPSIAHIVGHIFDSIFLDSLDADLERLQRINKTISLISTRRLEQGGVTLRPVDVLTISPSESIAEIAEKHIHLLPRSLRYLLRGVGAYGNHGSTLVSYLLFEKPFCRELITLGYKDAMNSMDEIKTFLDIGTKNE